MITCIGEPNIIANTAHGHVPARIQVDMVVEADQLLIGCGMLLRRLIFDECDAVKTLHSWFAMLQPHTPLACVMLPILYDHLIEPIQGVPLLVECLSEFFHGEMSKPVVVIPVVYVAVQLRRVWCCRSQ